MDLVFWQHILSIHQADFMKELAKLPDTRVTIVVSEAVPESRQQFGWPADLDYGSAEVINLQGTLPDRRLMARMPVSAFHVFSGLTNTRFIDQALGLVLDSHQQIGFYMEPWEMNFPFKMAALKLRFGRLIARLDAFSPIYLSTGAAGLDQLRALGVRESHIYPFGYFLAGTKNAPVPPSSAQRGSTVRGAFVGALSQLKNVAVAAEAAAELKEELSLTFIGDGPERNRVETIAEESDGRVSVQGVLANDEVRQELANYDFLILPSTYDGWGAVVSEALLAGTRVLVSAACGSSQVVRHELLGEVFTPTADGVSAALRNAYARGQISGAERLQIASWADRAISASAGAQYLQDIVQFHLDAAGQRPVPPWCRTELSVP